MLVPRPPRKGKRQRFYARNALKTTLDAAYSGVRCIRFGRSEPPLYDRIHPALTSFADEFCGTLARLIAYVGALALLAILGIALWDQLPAAMSETCGLGAGDAQRAFTISQLDSHDKTETYEIFRHPLGGRKDIFRWADADRTPVAELEIYRPGAELKRSGCGRCAIRTRCYRADWMTRQVDNPRACAARRCMA